MTTKEKLTKEFTEMVKDASETAWESKNEEDGKTALAYIRGLHDMYKEALRAVELPDAREMFDV